MFEKFGQSQEELNDNQPEWLKARKKILNKSNTVNLQPKSSVPNVTHSIVSNHSIAKRSNSQPPISQSEIVKSTEPKKDVVEDLRSNELKNVFKRFRKKTQDSDEENKKVVNKVVESPKVPKTIPHQAKVNEKTETSKRIESPLSEKAKSEKSKSEYSVKSSESKRKYVPFFKKDGSMNRSSFSKSNGSLDKSVERSVNSINSPIMTAKSPKIIIKTVVVENSGTEDTSSDSSSSFSSETGSTTSLSSITSFPVTTTKQLSPVTKKPQLRTIKQVSLSQEMISKAQDLSESVSSFTSDSNDKENDIEFSTITTPCQSPVMNRQNFPGHTIKTVTRTKSSEIGKSAKFGSKGVGLNQYKAVSREASFDCKNEESVKESVTESTKVVKASNVKVSQYVGKMNSKYNALGELIDETHSKPPLQASKPNAIPSKLSSRGRQQEREVLSKLSPKRRSASMPKNSGIQTSRSISPLGGSQSNLYRKPSKEYDANTRTELMTSLDRLISQSLLELGPANTDQTEVDQLVNNWVEENSQFMTDNPDGVFHMQEKTINLQNGMQANVVIRAVKKRDDRPSLIRQLQPSTSLLSLTGSNPPMDPNDKTKIKRGNSNASTISSDNSNSTSTASSMSHLSANERRVARSFAKNSEKYRRSIAEIYMTSRRKTEQLLMNLEMDLSAKGYGRLQAKI